MATIALNASTILIYSRIIKPASSVRQPSMDVQPAPPKKNAILASVTYIH
jgi:hypothetical protein